MSPNRLYIFLAIVFLVLSAFGAKYLLSTRSSPVTIPQPDPIDQLLYPTSTAPVPIITTSSPSPTSSPITTSPIISPVPTSTTQTLSDDKYGFSLTYASSRKLYESGENGGTRFTLYSSAGNITIHVGHQWSWSHPGRNFTTDLLISGQPTFVYKVSSQTIVDFQKDGLNYTIQCVHKDIPNQIEECQQVMSSFVLTSK